MSVKRLDPPPVRHDARLCALVLAAGAGRRFGGGKLTAPWRGGVLLDGALAAAFASPVQRVIVVTGGDAAVGPAARAFAEVHGEAARMQLCAAGDWALGLSASLRVGLAAAPAHVAAAFVFLGDMPAIPHALAWRLAERLAGDVDAVQPAHAGAPGHPVLLARRLWAAAMALQGDRGAQRLLDGPGVRLERVEVTEPGVTLDVDTPEALASLQGAL